MDYGFQIYRGRLEKYFGYSRHVVIPDGVREIESRAFLDRDMVESVVIPDSVSVIGDLAFCGCRSSGPGGLCRSGPGRPYRSATWNL